VTADVSLVAPGVIALIAVEGPITDGALEAALAGWSVAETGPTTRRLSAGDRVVDLEWHGGRASLAWQPASPAR
jgi:hypothetical protein